MATIEAADEQLVTGTDGDDVIVARSVDRIESGGGHDVVCASAPGGHETSIDAGAGDDEVETSTSGPADDAYFFVRLGSGDDTFDGGAGLDTVTDGDRAAVGQDEIETGEGDDIVISGRVGATNLDVVRLGGGHDSARLRGRVVGPVEGGTGMGADDDDLVLIDTREVRYDLDLAAGTASIGLDEVVLSGFTAVTLPGDARSIAVSGTEGPDRVAVERRRAPGRTVLDVDLGAGDDDLTLNGVGGARGSVDLGAGVRDELTLDSGKGFSSGRSPFTGAVAGALTGELRAAGGRLDLAGVEDFALVHFRRLDLRGNAAANHVYVATCVVEVFGGAGDDRIRVGAAPRSECPGRDGEGQRLAGQAGDDKLWGSGLDDVLIGGPGSDRADGGPGRDLCAAETTVECETS